MKSDEIKSRLTIYDILNYYHIKPNSFGFFCCPFHAEKTPSFKVYSNGKWKCFGCGKSGDLIDFVAEYENTDIKKAIQIISDRFGLGLDRELSYEQKKRYALEQQRRDFLTYCRQRDAENKKNMFIKLCEHLNKMRVELLRLDPISSEWWNLFQKMESLDYITTVISGGALADAYPTCEFKIIYGTNPDELIWKIFTKQLRLY